ncbi:MAG: membrane integrity-associated transporter subunit PqiC [Proteobacteria bacterium]|nr:membrane integrity-associated transporter subunit PqiC [Pseudomonadota bacterium]
MRQMLLSLVAAALLAGCTGSLFQSKLPATATYQLAVRGLAAAPAGPALPVDLAVLKPRMEPGLETERIAALYPDRRLEFYAGAQWSGVLDDVLQALTVQAFARQANLRSVSGESTRFYNTHWLELNVEDFQAEYRTPGAPPVIKVRISARLGSTSDHVGQWHCEVQAERAASADRMSAIIEAFEAVTNEVLGQLVEASRRDLAGAG